METLKTCLILGFGVLSPMLVGLLALILVGGPVYLCTLLWTFIVRLLIHPVMSKVGEIPFAGRFLRFAVGLCTGVPLMVGGLFAFFFPGHFLMMCWCGGEFEPDVTGTGAWYFDFYMQNFSWLGKLVSPTGNPNGPVANNPFLSLFWILLEAPFLMVSLFSYWLLEFRIFYGTIVIGLFDD